MSPSFVAVLIGREKLYRLWAIFYRAILESCIVVGKGFMSIVFERYLMA